MGGQGHIVVTKDVGHFVGVVGGIIAGVWVHLPHFVAFIATGGAGE